jgi:predicted nucleotidyltransferase component of viral defense system
MFSIPGAHPMAFKGGTSLSKVYEIIDRFTGDVDITLDFQQFNDTDYSKYPEVFDPFADGVSKTQISKYSDRLKSYVKSYAINVVAPHIQSNIHLSQSNQTSI